MIDHVSSSVRALAVDPAGRIFFDTGSPATAFLGRIDSSGQSDRLTTGVPSIPDPIDPAALLTTRTAPSAGRLAPDGGGGVLVSAGARIIDVDQEHGLRTLAGDPSSPAGAVGTGSEGDGGPAVAARFLSARSLTTDDAGNVYVADQNPGESMTVRIRFINRGAFPVTVYPGTPEQLTVAPGSIDTIAGRPGAPGGPAGTGSPALNAVIHGVPPSLAAAAGRLYVGSFWSEAGARRTSAGVQMINLGGTPMVAHGTTVGAGAMTMVAGGGPSGFRGDGGPAGAAAFGYLPGISADAAGNLFVADASHQRVRRIDRAGMTTTIAGAGPSGALDGGFNGNGRPANTARLNRPADVKAGPHGQLFISDQMNGQIRVIDPSGSIRAAPGENVGLGWICAPSSRGGRAPDTAVTLIGQPNSVAADARGNIYTVLTEENEVKRIDGTGSVTNVAGTGTPRTASANGDGGAALSASLSRPVAVATDARGSLYVLDDGGARVRFINLGTSAVTSHGVTIGPGVIDTIAGDGRPGFSGDGGRAVKARLSSDNQGLLYGGLVAVPDGSLFIADAGNARVRRVDAAGTISTYAGEGAPSPRSVCCRVPTSLGADARGNLLITDWGGGRVAPVGQPRVWFINRGSRPVRIAGVTVAADSVMPIAGNGAPGFSGDGGRALDAELGLPGGVVMDRQGNVYIADVAAGAAAVGSIRRVDAAGLITTAVGDGAGSLAGYAGFGSGGGFNGDGRSGPFTSVRSPRSVAMDRCGNLVFTDGGNDRVRRLGLAGTCPALAEIGAASGGSRSRSAMWVLAVAVAVALAVSAGGTVLVTVRRRRHKGMGHSPR